MRRRASRDDVRRDLFDAPRTPRQERPIDTHQNTPQAPTVVLIDCPDQKGLVHAISGVLLEYSLNILSNHEFVDEARAHFYMRTAFEGIADVEAIANALRAVLPASARVLITQPRPKDIVLLGTKEHHCVGDLLLRESFGELPMRIRAVISNHDVLATLCARFDKPFYAVPHTGTERAAHEAELAAIIDGYAPDFIVLAKYMRVLTPSFVDRYARRVINIHHSFLPAFVGARPYQQAFDRGVKIIGATSHFVTSDLDEGPIIAQSVIPVAHTHSARDMAMAGRDVEKVVLARALKLVCEDRVFIAGNRTIIFD